jgi:hypothetical protein
LLQRLTCFYEIAPRASVQAVQKYRSDFCSRYSKFSSTSQKTGQLFKKQDNFSKKCSAGVQLFIYSIYQQPHKWMVTF